MLGRARQLVQPVPDQFDPADFEDLIGGSQAELLRWAAGELETTAQALRQLERHLQALKG